MLILFATVSDENYQKLNKNNTRLMRILNNTFQNAGSSGRSRMFTFLNPKNVNNLSYLVKKVPKNTNFYRRYLSQAKDELNKTAINKIKRAIKTHLFRIKLHSTRVPSNPHWKSYVRRRIFPPNKKSKPNTPKPKVPRNFGLWRGPYNTNGYYQSPNMKFSYYPKRNVLVTNQLAYRNASKKFTLPRNEWMK
jgi:hypothetical protein